MPLMLVAWNMGHAVIVEKHSAIWPLATWPMPSARARPSSAFGIKPEKSNMKALRGQSCKEQFQ